MNPNFFSPFFIVINLYGMFQVIFSITFLSSTLKGMKEYS